MSCSSSILHINFTTPTEKRFREHGCIHKLITPSSPNNPSPQQHSPDSPDDRHPNQPSDPTCSTDWSYAVQHSMMSHPRSVPRHSQGSHDDPHPSQTWDPTCFPRCWRGDRRLCCRGLLRLRHRRLGCRLRWWDWRGGPCLNRLWDRLCSRGWSCGGRRSCCRRS
jgi:hypothetical protein